MVTKLIKQKSALLIGLFLLSATHLRAQYADEREWDLDQCISWALEHNIQVNKKLLSVTSSEANLTMAKSELLPNLSASVSKSYRNANSNDGWDYTSSSSASLGANMTLFQGGAVLNGIKQSKLEVEVSRLDVESTKNSIILSITQAYLNVLYAKESLDYYREVVATSEKQVFRAKELLKSGSIARYDLAQIEAEYASSKYSLVQAQNTLITRTTNLKQLLEIPVRDTFTVYFPEMQTEEVSVLPSKTEAFDKALSFLPEVKSSQLSKRIAEIGLNISRSGYLPTLSMSASYSSGLASSNPDNFTTQLINSQNQQLGFNLSIPIFNRNATKVSVQKSRINFAQAELSLQETEKTLLQEVENAYQDVENGISRFDAARIQAEAADESYRLSEEQFNLGMLNTVELLTAKSNLLNAKKELIQSKYNAILSRKILDFYMGVQIFNNDKN